jgi:hypothetical protein
VGSLTYVGSNAVTLGTIAGTNGLSATGAVDIATVTGDLTVAHNVATTSATSTALTLNAGRLAMAGTAAGGNLLVSGSPSITVGAGGRYSVQRIDREQHGHDCSDRIRQWPLPL